jgi:hypothetical protein
MTAALLTVMVMLLVAWGGLLAAFARPLWDRWREPVFRHPILALESDDWGAGPAAQADALMAILGLLRAFKDVQGKFPVMTLGVVFEIPDTARMAREGLTEYRPRGLDDPSFVEIRRVMKAGIEEGIFRPQLHGLCHYWPPALMRAVQADPAVRDWMTQGAMASTEALPSPLQSRWVDASVLPSRPLDHAEIVAAVAEEAEAFQREFGEAPQVAVATTFVWTEAVERAWRGAGVRVVITPGHRSTCRDANGRPGGVDRTMLTGERSDGGQWYLVRDVYFEPALGHPPERMVHALADRTRQGRACLVEIHRFNFLEQRQRSLDALLQAMKDSLAAFPDVRFLSPADLAHAIADRDASVLETGFGARVRKWSARLAEIPRFRKLARMTGLAFPLMMLGRLR